MPAEMDEFCSKCRFRRRRHGAKRCPGELDQFGTRPFLTDQFFEGSGKYHTKIPGDNWYDDIRMPEEQCGPVQMKPKAISDWPHSCPGCGGPAYIGVVPSAAKCRKACREQYA